MSEEVYFAVFDNDIYIRGTGNITFLSCSALKELYRKKINEHINYVYLNLEDCEYMDSTFIGTIVILNKLCLEKKGEKITLVKPTGICRKILSDSGVLSLVEITQDSVSWPENENIVSPGYNDNTDLILESHQELSSLSEKNRKKFQLLQNILIQKKKRTEKQK
jgi:anti-sigma B factor antagonist